MRGCVSVRRVVEACDVLFECVVVCESMEGFVRV